MSRYIDADILIEIGMFDEEEVEEMLRYAGIKNEGDDDDG